MFRTKFERKRVFTCPGNEIEVEFELQVNEKGIKEPVEVGKINVREEINSYRDSVDLQILLQKYMNGDREALNKRAASYFDASEMPKTLAEAYRMSENGKLIFDKLSTDIKEKFNNDYGQFLQSVGTRSFFEAFGNNNKPSDNGKNNEVTDEQKSE